MEAQAHQIGEPIASDKERALHELRQHFEKEIGMAMSREHLKIQKGKKTDAGTIGFIKGLEYSKALIELAILEMDGMINRRNLVNEIRGMMSEKG